MINKNSSIFYIISIVISLYLAACSKGEKVIEASSQPNKQKLNSDTSGNQNKNKTVPWVVPPPVIKSINKETQIIQNVNPDNIITTNDYLVFPQASQNLKEVTVEIKTDCYENNNTTQEIFEYFEPQKIKFLQFFKKSDMFRKDAQIFQKKICDFEFVYKKQNHPNKKARISKVIISESEIHGIHLTQNKRLIDSALINLENIDQFEFQTDVKNKDSEFFLECEGFVSDYRGKLEEKNNFSHFHINNPLVQKSGYNTKPRENCRIFQINNERVISKSNYFIIQTGLDQLSVSATWTAPEQLKVPAKNLGHTTFNIYTTLINNPHSNEAYLTLTEEQFRNIQLRVVNAGAIHGLGKFSSKKEYLGFKSTEKKGNQVLLTIAPHSTARIKTWVLIDQKCWREYQTRGSGQFSFPRTVTEDIVISRYMVYRNPSSNTLMTQTLTKSGNESFGQINYDLFPTTFPHLTGKLSNQLGINFPMSHWMPDLNREGTVKCEFN